MPPLFCSWYNIFPVGKNVTENKNYSESFIKAFSACIINDLPDDYIKLLKSVYYGKEFLTIEELNDIKNVEVESH